MQLDNNQQLYEYLVGTAAKLNACGAVELGGAVLAASRHVRAIPATEFLGESCIALRRVEKQPSLLSENERSELSDVLHQLDEAFTRR
jgi:hypothetical protein